jgi:hypothetical protein
VITVDTRPARLAREHSAYEKSARLEKARFAVEVIGLLGIIGTLIYTANSVTVAKDAVKASTDQLAEARHASVYEHQLELWRLAANQRDLAPYIIGGRKINEEVTPIEGGQAIRQAAIINTLDFYAYVFAQFAPRDDSGNTPPDILSASLDDEPPSGWTSTDWSSWVTWSATIVDGFRGAPSMCDLLNATASNGAYAYEISFREAVRDGVSNCVT